MLSTLGIFFGKLESNFNSSLSKTKYSYSTISDSCLILFVLGFRRCLCGDGAACPPPLPPTLAILILRLTTQCLLLLHSLPPPLPHTLCHTILPTCLWMQWRGSLRLLRRLPAWGRMSIKFKLQHNVSGVADHLEPWHPASAVATEQYQGGRRRSWLLCSTTVSFNQDLL